jgi:hypothetical protein
VCVRYGYDAESRLRFPTVELIIEQVSWSLALNGVMCVPSGWSDAKAWEPALGARRLAKRCPMSLNAPVTHVSGP